MDAPPPDQHSFYQRVERRALVEQSRVDGRVPEDRQLPAPFVAHSGGFVLGVRRGLAFALKQATRALYLSPLLVIAKLALRASDPETSDHVTVAFVLLVVGFFALLNVYVVWSVIAWWSGALREPALLLRLPFDAEGRDALGIFRAATARARTDLAAAGPTQQIRVRGVVRHLGPDRPASPVILSDAWAPGGSPPNRSMKVADFAVQGEDDVTVVVRVLSAPTVIGPPRQNELAGTWTQELREGDRVEVAGEVTEVLADPQRVVLGGRERSVRPMNDDGARGAYRGATHTKALLLTSVPGRPVVITRLTSALAGS